MVVVGFSAGPIPWPVGRRAGGPVAGASGLIVYDGLARAIRREPRLAVAQAWGVSPYKVTQWRRALGLGTPPAERARRSNAARNKAQAFLPKGRAWTADEDAIVRTHPPKDAARLTGHSLSAVYNRRAALGLPDARKARSRPA